MRCALEDASEPSVQALREAGSGSPFAGPRPGFRQRAQAAKAAFTALQTRFSNPKPGT